jgi:hypothetical protein
MNPELEALWNEAMQSLDDLAADRKARGVRSLPEFFPVQSSFAHDDPEAHALARMDFLDGKWSEDATDEYRFDADFMVVSVNVVSTVMRREATANFEVRQAEILETFDSGVMPVTAPQAQFSFCAA